VNADASTALQVASISAAFLGVAITISSCQMNSDKMNAETRQNLDTAQAAAKSAEIKAMAEAGLEPKLIPGQGAPVWLPKEAN